MRMRTATLADARALADILNDAIADDAAIGKDRAIDEAERAAWITDRDAQGYPVLVAVSGDAGKVIGFASFGEWREGNGYRHTVELSIYVHADHQSEGVGSALLESLIGCAQAQGRHVMIAAIESENEASIELHRGFGFEVAGQYREVGAKRGQWLDLTVMQRVLSEDGPTQ